MAQVEPAAAQVTPGGKKIVGPPVVITLADLMKAMEPKPIEPQKCGAKEGKHCTATFKLEGTIDSDSKVALKNWFDAWEESKLEHAVIEIDSMGGDVYSIYEMYQEMKEFKAKTGAQIHCVVKGKAYSAAFFFLQGCDERSMTPLSLLLAHNPKMGVSRDVMMDHLVMRQHYQDLEITTNTFADIICEKMKLSRAKYFEMVEGRNWDFNAKEAMKYNAVDNVIPTLTDKLKSLRERGK